MLYGTLETPHKHSFTHAQTLDLDFIFEVLKHANCVPEDYPGKHRTAHENVEWVSTLSLDSMCSHGLSVRMPDTSVKIHFSNPKIPSFHPACTDTPGEPQTVREITHLELFEMFRRIFPTDRPVLIRTVRDNINHTWSVTLHTYVTYYCSPYVIHHCKSYHVLISRHAFNTWQNPRRSLNRGEPYYRSCRWATT